MLSEARIIKGKEKLWMKRSDTRRWRRRSIFDSPKLIGEKNSGQVYCGMMIKGRQETKLLRHMKEELIEISEIEKSRCSRPITKYEMQVLLKAISNPKAMGIYPER